MPSVFTIEGTRAKGRKKSKGEPTNCKPVSGNKKIELCVVGTSKNGKPIKRFVSKKNK